LTFGTSEVISKATKDVAGEIGDAFNGQFLSKIACSVTGGIGEYNLEKMIVLQSHYTQKVVNLSLLYELM